MKAQDKLVTWRVGLYQLVAGQIEEVQSSMRLPYREKAEVRAALLLAGVREEQIASVVRLRSSEAMYHHNDGWRARLRSHFEAQLRTTTQDIFGAADEVCRHMLEQYAETSYPTEEDTCSTNPQS